MQKSIATSLLPRNKGFPRTISAMMQPAAHVSTDSPYSNAPSSIYGARYHRVEISGVWWFSPNRVNLACPKSHSLRVSSAVTNTFWGFRSRCITPLRCRYCKADSNCLLKRYIASIILLSYLCSAGLYEGHRADCKDGARAWMRSEELHSHKRHLQFYVMAYGYLTMLGWFMDFKMTTSLREEAGNPWCLRLSFIFLRASFIFFSLS